MPTALIAAVLSVVLAAVLSACGGAPPVTISEYEAWCGKDASDYSDATNAEWGTWGYLADVLNALLDDKLTPPAESGYEQHYSERRKLAKAVADYARSRDRNDEYDQSELANEENIVALARSVYEIEQTLPSLCQSIV